MSELLFEYKVRARHRLGWKEFSFYATTDIEEFLNRNNIEYVRNATDTVENRLFKENKRLNKIINSFLAYLQDNEEHWKDTSYNWDSLIYGELAQRLEMKIKMSLEEELERESNIKEEDTGLEHNTFIDIRNTLKTVLRRLQELKGSDKK